MRAVVFRVAIGIAVLILGFAGNVGAQQWPNASTYSDAPRMARKCSLRYVHQMWVCQQPTTVRRSFQQNFNRGDYPGVNSYDQSYARGNGYQSSGEYGAADSRDTNAPTVYQPPRDNYNPVPSYTQHSQPNFSSFEDSSASTAPVENPFPTSFSLSEGSKNPVYMDAVWGRGSQAPGPQVASFYNQGFASDATVRAYVGNLSMRVVRCHQVNDIGDQRTVRVDMDRANFQYTQVIDGILLRAAELVWRECPYTQTMHGINYYVFDLHEIDLYLPDGSLALRASLANHALFGNGNDFRWWVENFAAERDRQLAQTAAQARFAQQMQEANQRTSDTFGFIGRLIELAILGGIFYWLYSLRETFARWYYSLTPHPAKAIIDHAVGSNAPLNEHDLADAMRETPSNPVEQDVRRRQADELMQRARQHADKLRAEAERLRKKASEEGAFIRSQTDLADAAVSAELEKARVNALRKRVME